MRNLLKQSLGLVVALTALACGSSNDSGTNEASEGAAASGATTGGAGKTANSGGSTSSARGGSGAATGASGTTGTANAPRAGTSATTQPPAAGKGGAGGRGAVVADEDAGVPASGGSGGSAQAGSGGSVAQAGSGAAGKAGASAAGSGGSSAAVATFTQVYALISTGCAGATCHVNANAAGGMLSMPDKATAYKNLVNVDATQCRGEKRVVPNDPAKSELVASLKHIQVGSCARTPRMPDNMPQWKDSDIALVTSWIEAGAQDN